MIITTKKVIAFKIPEEYSMAQSFKAEYSDWIEIVTTEYISFKQENTYAIETKEEKSGNGTKS